MLKINNFQFEKFTMLGKLVLMKKRSMKIISFIFCLFLASLNLASGQNYLNLKNTKTGEERVIENNKTGQLEGLIREWTGLSIDYHLRKYDGRPFYPEEIVVKVREILA